VAQDVAAQDGPLSPWVAAGLRAAGVGSNVLTPFGVDEQMLGFVTAKRLGPGRPWSAAEVGAVESIAADIGRGLHHARLYEAENRLVEDLKSLDQAKSDFFATVSHELRAPLTSIEGYVEMLAEGEGGPVTGEQRKMLDVVDRSAVRLRNLIDDVFTLSKLESDAFTTVMRPVEVAEVISAATDELQPEVARHGLTLTSDCPQHGLTVQGDTGQLGRVLVNLLSNAVKFTPSGGHITVTAAAAEGSAVITVADTGIGIPAHDQQELFTRFFRASNAIQQSIPGTGLGLAIVRTIVTNHGGTITLTSHEGQGTTFTIRIPQMAEGTVRIPLVAAGRPG
jgi:signal transduction histidine kinase